MIGLDQLNSMAPGDFTAALGGIFEHSPWVAAGAAAARPFASRLDLLDAMRAVVDRAAAGEQLALIRAHPELGARGRSRAALTEASAREQRRAGLDACTDEEFARLQEWNREYVARFGFPFILAVRGHDPASILTNVGGRLRHDLALERRTALTQIGLIAGYRLADLVCSPAAGEILAMQARCAAAGGAGGSLALVREWMLAAGLELDGAEGDGVTGVLRSASGGGRQFALGAGDAALPGQPQDALQPPGLLVGIAVAQQLRQRGIALPFDLVIRAPGGAGMATPGVATPGVAGAEAAARAAQHLEDTIGAAAASAADPAWHGRATLHG